MDLSHIRFEGTHTNRGSLGPQVLVRHPSLARRRPPVQDEPVASGLPARILSQQGLDPARYRHRPLERRLGACLRALGVSSEVAAWERVESDRAAQAVALNTLLIGVSSFFRDAAVFEVIRTTVVDVLKRLGRPPRVWSVGCSTGTELYSVAMILEREGLLDGAELLGTDSAPMRFGRHERACSSAIMSRISTAELAIVTSSARARPGGSHRLCAITRGGKSRMPRA